MTTPGILATRPTHASITAQKRRLEGELATLTERLSAATAERVEATHALNRARGRKDNASTQLAEHRDLLPMLPPDPRRDQQIAAEAEAVEELRTQVRHARALAAAATVVEEAFVLEADWCKQHIQNLDRPPHIDCGKAVPVTGRAEDIAVATSYEVILRRDGEELTRRRLTHRKAVGLVDAWLRAQNARVLRDAAGCLFIESPRQVVELRPTTLRVAPNEGGVMMAALAAYGWKAFEDSEGGCSFLVLPVDPSTPESETYSGPYLMIASGEDAARPVHAHDEPWTLTLFGANGEYQDVLYTGDPGLSLAADSAACARAVAEYAARDTNTPAA